jgi:hypothetical protein
MSTIDWGWIILGVITLGNFWIAVGLIMNLLRKLDRCEDKLMCMSEAYPHAAMIELQTKGMALQESAMRQNQVPEQTPDWMGTEAG